MKINLSLKGKIAIGIIIIYLVIAIIVPSLPLKDPMTFKAPPSDIFAPQIIDNYSFPEKVYRVANFGYSLFVITSHYQFLSYDMVEHKIEFKFTLPKGNYSTIQLLRIYPDSYPIFYSNDTIYLYYYPQQRFIEYPVEGTKSLYILNDPFNAFKGFIALNSTGLYAFSFSIYMPYPSPPLWKIYTNATPLGIHYSYKHIYISFKDKLWDVNSKGKISRIINGTFTSNPIYLPIYGSSKVYVASHNKVLEYSTKNGSLLREISMPVEITMLEYRGQALYAFSPKGMFGKVNLLQSGFSWKIENVKKYIMDPFIDGLGVIFKEGKIAFVLISDGTIQWGVDVKVYKIFIGQISHVPYLFAVLSNQTTISQYSYSGRLIAPLPPSNKYPMGTDAAGRDILSQFLWGFREEIYIALISGLAVLLIGTLWGLLAGYFTGIVDDSLLLLSDSFLFVPAIGYAALMIYIMGVSHHVEATIAASIMALAPLEARAVRNYTKVVKEKAYVESARMAGAGHWRIIFVHILPEIKGISLVYAISATTMALLLEVGVSFLGFGNYAIPTWGWMITNAYFTGYWDRWWLIVPPLIALWLLVYSLYLVSQDLYTTEYILSIESRSITAEEIKSK